MPIVNWFVFLPSVSEGSFLLLKRIIISIAAVFVLILNIAIPFKTYADNVEVNPLYISFEDWRNYRSISTTGRKEFIAYYHVYREALNRDYYCTFGFSLSDSDFENKIDNVSFDNNIITVQFKSSAKFYFSTDYVEKNRVGSYQNTERNSYTIYTKKFEFNVSTSELKIFDDDNNLDTSFSGIDDDNTIFHCDDFTTNLIAIEDNYNVNVSFSPILSGNVDRKDNNGNTLESFRMTVDNYSRFDVQILMTIVKHGSNISFYSPSVGGTLALQRVITSGNPVFTWWKDSPNYTFDSTITEEQNFAHAHHPDVSTFYNVEKQYGPSPWHIVGANNGHLVQDFDWTQINLEDHGNYDVLVYAVRNDYGIPSRQALSSDYDYYVDYSDIQLVYSSNFTLTNPYKYDSNNKNHGNYSLMNDVLLSSTSKDYIDSNGDVHEGKELNDLLNKQKEREGEWFSNYSADTSYLDTEYYSASVPSSFKNSYNSFISFVSSIFDRFPGDIKNIYKYSFLAICVLGIIKKVT